MIIDQMRVCRHGGWLWNFTLLIFSIILCIYLILGGLTFKYKRIRPTISILAITFISKELASQQPVLNEFVTKEIQETPYQSLLYYLLECDFSSMQH